MHQKKSTHLSKKYHTNHTEKIGKGDSNVHWQDQTMTSLNQQNKNATVRVTPLALPCSNTWSNILINL